MSNIAESFQILYDIKENIKNSIENKGVAVGDAPFTDYSSKIDEIMVDPRDGNYDEGYTDGRTEGYEEGYDNGRNDGYDEGYTEGNTKGITEGKNVQKAKLTTLSVDVNGTYEREDGYKSVTVSVDTDSYYSDGYNNGRIEGYNSGKVDGYGEGKTDGENAIKANMQSITITENGPYSDERGYKQVIVNVTGDPNAGYDEGYTTGFNNGYSEGYTSGTTAGKDIGYSDGYNKGYNSGYSSGTTDGYSDGKADGITEGYNSGFSEGKTEGRTVGRVEGQNEIINKTIELTVIENGTYPTSNNIFYNSVTVAVPQSTDIQGAYDSGYSDGYSDGISNSDGALVFTPQNTSFMLKYSEIEGTVVIDFAKVTRLISPFQYSTFLNGKSPLLKNSENIVDFSSLFYNTSFTEALYFDTSNATNMVNMFANNSGLTSVPIYNTTNVVYMGSMFYNCKNLQSVGLFDTSNVIDMNSMFKYCEILETIPQFNTSNVTNMKEMFSYCKNLHTLPLLNFSSATDLYRMFYGCSNLANLGGFDGLRYPIDLSPSKVITRDSMINVFNSLGQAISQGGTNIIIAQAVYNNLTADDIAIATNKGWTVSIS
jgi:surface protein